MASYLCSSILFIFSSQFAEFAPLFKNDQIWYGDFIGDLPDPQNVGVQGKLYVVNETTLQIINFSYNGQAPDLYFWADREPVLTSSGLKIPTFEFGSSVLGKYESADRVVIVLPSYRKVNEFSTIGLWCLKYAKDFGSVKVDKSRTPPKAQFLDDELKGSKYHVGSGPILILDRKTIKIFGFTFEGDKAPDGYFFVGTGSKPDHNGVKVPIRGRDIDGEITAMNERYKGGQDLILDLPESHDVFNIDWLSVYCYKFRVDFGHAMLRNLSDRIPPYVPPQKRYDDIESERLPPWNPTILLGTDSRTNFTFQLGVPGGTQRGYEKMAKAKPNQYVWYVNGYMAPELYLRRGISYTFNVEGGDDKSTEKFYNPLYISDDPFGGYTKLSDDERKQVNIYAGKVSDNMIDPQLSNNIGRLCLWSADNTEDNGDNYEQFVDFRNTLRLKCAIDGSLATFTWIPDELTPDILYYQSSSNYHMGWKIHIVDSIPEHLDDFKEEPYQYEIWLEHQSLREVPRRVSACGYLSISSVLMLLLAVVSIR